MRGRRQGFRGIRGRGPALAFVVLTALGLALTVHLANRAAAITQDERAFAWAGACATQGSANPDCVREVAGIALESPLQDLKSLTARLKVSADGIKMTLTFPHTVGPVFKRVQADDYVGLTRWRGAIVAATAHGDTETTTAAPAERYRNQLVATFFSSAFTLVLAGMTVYSTTFTDWFSTDRRLRTCWFAAALVTFTGFAAVVGAAMIMERGSLRSAVLAVSIADAAVLVGTGVVLVQRRFQQRRSAGR